jgi:putative tryptophan/tyrosine transport system substrate-binding protein
MPITRRAAIAALLAVGVAAPIVVRAQPLSRIPRVGVIGERSTPDHLLAAFAQGLRDLGYVEGQNVRLEYRYAQGASDRFPRLAAELVRLDVDVLVVGGTVAAQAAKAVTTTVPIVFTLAGDPVASGLVASLARPGGNATGMSNLVPELSAKQLELLKAAAPQVSRISLLYNPDNAVHAGPGLEGAREAARTLGVELQPLEIRSRHELASAFAALTAWRAGAVLALGDPVIGNELVQFSQLTTRHRLPAMYSRREFAEAGGLLSYGPHFSESYRRAASYVDRILKGARPADLPVERPTTFELVVNLTTARTLGLTLPPSLLGRADQVIK